MPPSRVRGNRTARDRGLTFTLTPRGGFDGAAPLAHLTGRMVECMERVREDGTFTRTLQVGEHRGWLSLHLAGPAPRLTLTDGLIPAFRTIVASVRGALDLDTDVDAVNAHLAREGFRDDVRREALVRLPGAIDPFELAIRAVIGQQVTVRAATTIVGRLVEALGTPIEAGEGLPGRVFPDAGRIADAGAPRIARLGMPLARAETVIRVARSFADGRLVLARGAIAAGRAGLAELPGIGPWTMEYIALRALGDPDAFPFGDSALRAAFDGDLKRASDAWRPWRAYAAARLWRRAPIQRRKAA